MPSYIVTWKIEIDAPSPREAAMIANEDRMNPDLDTFMVTRYRGDGFERELLGQVFVDLSEGEA